MDWPNFLEYYNNLPIWVVDTVNGAYYVPAETKEDAVIGIKGVLSIELYPL